MNNVILFLYNIFSSLEEPSPTPLKMKNTPAVGIPTSSL